VESELLRRFVDVIAGDLAFIGFGQKIIVIIWRFIHQIK